jgi:HPt (histidine-containing phosphotransfer) domain-containing protein
MDEPEKMIDLNYLSSLAKGNKGFVKEMIAIFLNDNPAELRSLETGIAEQDFDKIKSIAHKLKSTIPFIGLDKIIGKEVLEMESLAADHSDLKGIESRFKKVKEVCEKACLELEEVEVQ